VAGCKINLQKSLAFLYTKQQTHWEGIYGNLAFLYTKQQTHWEGIYGNSPIYNSLKKIKCLGIKLTKDVNDLCKENYKPLKKEIRETTEDGKISCAHVLVEST
jgi:hypothetical protein